MTLSKPILNRLAGGRDERSKKKVRFYFQTKYCPTHRRTRAVCESCGHLQQSTEMSYRFIEKNRSAFPVKKMCQALEVTQSGFYCWGKVPLSKRKQVNIRIKERVKKIFSAHKGMAGSPLITADLQDEREFSTFSRPRVARLMREMGLRCKTMKKFVVTTDSKPSQPVAPNLLDRKFTASASNTAWGSYITSLKVGTKWYYLTVFIS